MTNNPIPIHRTNANLLHLPVARTIVQSAYFPVAIQFFVLLVYGGLIYVGLQSATSATRYTNLANLAIWSLWWPGIILLTVVQTRLWCTACPIGLVTKTLGRFGLNFKIPKGLRRNKLAVVIGLFLLHSLVVSFDIHHVPALAAVYLIGLMGYAAVVALIFEPDAFCSSFCPLSGIIGPYAMLSPTELRSADSTTCKACRRHQCAKICPRNLYMGTLDSNQECLLYFDCVKSCQSNNITFRKRAFLQDSWKIHSQTLGNALLVVVLLGIMIEEVGEEWSVFEAITTAVPRRLSLLGTPAEIAGYGWLEAVWLNFLLPLLVVGSAALLAHLITRRNSTMQNFARFTPALLPLVFSLHLTKMLHNFNDHLSYLPRALADPVGLRTTDAIVANPAIAPRAIISTGSLEGSVLLGVVTLGLIGSFYVLDMIAGQVEGPRPKWELTVYYTLLILLGGVFLVVIARWFGFGPVV